MGADSSGVYLWVLTLSTFLLLLCSSPATGQWSITEGHHVSMMTLTRADSGKSVKIRIGDTVFMRPRQAT
jgi:hypothetical protein